MQRANITETNLRFANLTERAQTNLIVIHHTGAEIDASAEQIHDWHLNQGWSGIGYHFVVRKNGTIERGRPEWAVGSHAYGENSHTIGIHLSGDFMQAYLTDQQIEMCSMLVAMLCEKYNITTDNKHIVGHCDLMSTDCPGTNLYSQLGTIIGKANWYRYGAPKPDAVIKDVVTVRSANAISEANKAKIKAILDYADVQFEAG